MSSEKWRKYKLGEIFDISSGLSKGGEEFGHGYPFLTFKDVFQNYFLPEKLESLANATQQEIKKCSIRKGDIFLTRTSETQEDLGMSSVALKDYENATFNGFTKRLRLKEGVGLEIYPEYIAYYFRNQKFRQQVSSVSTLTTRASLNNSMIEVLELELPSLKVQKAIGNILKALDDKIELNRRMNETLEGIAQAVWGEWFGKYASGEVELPEGWRWGKLGEIVEFKKGVSYKSEELKDSATALVTLKSFNRGGGFNFNGFKEYTGGYKNEQILSPGDIIIAQTDLTQNAEVVGSPAIVENPKKYQTLVASLDIVKCSPKNEFLSKEALYYFLQSQSFKEFCLSHTNGSTVLHLKSSELPNYEILIPDKKSLIAFQKVAFPLRSEIINNNLQSLTLTALRDALLPKLMRGEIIS
jgi:type I restriction enzyme S subunit